VEELKQTRPPPLPEKVASSITAQCSIWESDGSRHIKGISRLKHHCSLDSFTRTDLRPGSLLVEPKQQSTKPPTRPYRIISFDGGGVKGVFTLRLVERLFAKFPNLIKDVDLIAGTSTGGLIALLLARGYSPSQALELYRHNIPIIFNTNVFRRWSPFHAKYADAGRMEVFEHYFSGVTLGDLGKYVVITSFRMDGGEEFHGNETFFPSGGWRPALFSNLPKAQGRVLPDNDLPVSFAAMRTTSAPTYFPPFQGYADGGLFANNPSISAVSRAYSHFPGVTPDNTVVFSIGCGMSLKQIEVASRETHLDWGLKQLSGYFVDLLMESNQLSNEYTLRMLLPGRYHRLDSMLPRNVSLDDVTAVDEIIKAADSVDLNDAEQFLVTTFFGALHI
jgi:predicted acylesterase/phospholipase RssA